MYKQIPFEIAFEGTMFEIPELPGKRTFANCDDPYIHTLQDEPFPSYSEATPKCKWSAYRLYEKISGKEWIERFGFDLNRAAFTEEQILHFLKIGGTAFLPSKYAYFVTRGNDGFYLTHASHCNVGVMRDAQKEHYYLWQYPIDYPGLLVDRLKEDKYALLLCLYYPDMLRTKK